MPVFDIDAWVAHSRAIDLSEIDWASVPRTSIPPPAIRTLRYMQDIESHTIIYLRSLLATRAVDDPEVATFLACWLHEETFHGLALARFLEAAGHPLGARPRPRGQEPCSQWLEARATAGVSKAWPDFCAVHMTWGAINELTTLTGYRRLVALVDHPVLADLLERITLDESRHFFFYYRQAEMRLQRRGVARVARCSWSASGRPSAAACSRTPSGCSWPATCSPVRRGAPRSARSTTRSDACPDSPARRCSRRGWRRKRASPPGAIASSSPAPAPDC
jgi:hypothetical protein